MPVSEDAPDGVVAYRLDQIERRLEVGLAHMDDRMDKVQTAIAGLAFVRQDVYQSDQRAAAQRIATAETKFADRVKDVEDKADRALSTAFKAIGFSVTITLAVLGTFIGILQAIR